MGAVSAAGALILLTVTSRIKENDLRNEHQRLKSLIKERSEIRQELTKSRKELIKLRDEFSSRSNNPA